MCRRGIKNRVVSGNERENRAGWRVYREYGQDIALWSIINIEILNMETFNYGE